MTTESTDAETDNDKFPKAFGGIAKFARQTSAQIADQLGDLRDAAADSVEGFGAKAPDPYAQAVTDYNAAFTAMNDNGIALLHLRERSADLLGLVEELVNSIANTPKSFATQLEEIRVRKVHFFEAEDYARNDLDAARQSAAGAGSGLAAGAAVASLAPTAAMWVATTFGAASTGTAISTLTGAAATNAALAWLGGGALAAGGGGTAAGGALLALAGPIGWTVAGATLLVSIALFAKKRFDNRGEKERALLAVMENTASVMTITAQIEQLREQTKQIRGRLLQSYSAELKSFGADFATLTPEEKTRLGTLVNNAISCAALLDKRLDSGLTGE